VRALEVRRLGRVAYGEGLELQRRLVDARKADQIPDQLLLLEHPPVITLGAKVRNDRSHVLASDAELDRLGVSVFEAGRGGDVTYHGPGQLVGYPIMHATDVVAFLRTMEDAIAAALAEEGIESRGRDHEGAAYTGVWVEQRKIASIGVHVSRGVSAHGFAVNVDNDVEPFHQVTACGLPGVRMTSLALETGRTGTLPCLRKRVAYAYAQALGLRQRIVTPHRLGAPRPIPSMA
jgi:lipoyl(octanoyl) transferase